MKLSHLLCAAAALAAGPAWTGEGGGPFSFSGIAGGRADEAGWRRTFDVDPKNLGTVGHNPYFPLTPGLRIHLGGKDEAVVFSVMEETKVVDGVQTRVVEERESERGELVEIARNYFAIDRTTGDVYYFGEEVDDYKDGKIVGHAGAWLSGVNGAKFGLIMPGKPARGDKFYLEMAPGAEERVEIVDVDARLETPLRTFEQPRLFPGNRRAGYGIQPQVVCSRHRHGRRRQSARRDDRGTPKVGHAIAWTPCAAIGPSGPVLPRCLPAIAQG